MKKTDKILIEQKTALSIIKRLRKESSYFDDGYYDRLIDDIAVDFGLRNPDTGEEKESIEDKMRLYESNRP